jgi:hypothetical protein
MAIKNPDGSPAKYRVEPLKRKSVKDIEREKAEAKAEVKNKFAPKKKTSGKKK